MNSYFNGKYRRNSEGFAVVIIIILLTMTTFVITSSWYVLGMFSKNTGIYTLNYKAENILNNQRTLFRNVLINTNTDGGGYTTNGASRGDINNDDDDFQGGAYDIDGTADNDGEAFRHKIGLILPNSEENVLFIDKTYMNMAGFAANSLSGLTVFLDQNALCNIEIYNGDIYEENHKLVLKTKNAHSLQASKNSVPLPYTNIAPNDMIMVFISNDTDETISYSIGGIDTGGNEVINFIPTLNKDRNVDIYTSTVLQDENGQHITFGRIFYDILPGGKKPVSPTYLHTKSASGTVLELEWDINEKTSTGAYYLYRGIDTLVDCKEQYFLQKIPDGYKENSLKIEYTPGKYYYTLCGSNAPGTGSGLLNIGKLSLKSNVLEVIK